MESFGDKKQFVERHKEEISPLVDPNSDIDAALEAYRVKIYKCEKQGDSYDPDAQNVALSVSDPLSFGTARTLIERFLEDRRFKSILLTTDNVAVQGFEGLIKNDRRYKGFGEVNMQGGIIATLGKETTSQPVDIALAFIESQNSPSGSLAYEWKGVYGAKRFYIINEGWNGIGQRLDFFSRLKPGDVDAIVCNDETARRVLSNQLPAFEQKIQATGTPVLD